MSKLTDFLNTRRKDLKKDHWWSTYIWYFFLFSLIVIAGVNFAFFIVHWKELEFDFSKTSIYITFVGFLFAFAGINIYSIFNTNIEEEKKRLYDLNEQYEDEIKRTMLLLDFSKKHIKYYQLSQMIASMAEFNSQSGEWLDEFDALGLEFENFLYELSKVDQEEFETMSSDFTDIIRSVYHLFEAFDKRIKDPKNGFFKAVDKDLKNSFQEQLEKTIQTVNEMQTHDFSKKRGGVDNNQKEFGVMDGLIISWNALVGKFLKK